MNVGAYHRALCQGFSEKESVKIGEEAWEDDMIRRKDERKEPERIEPIVERFKCQQAQDCKDNGIDCSKRCPKHPCYVKDCNTCEHSDVCPITERMDQIRCCRTCKYWKTERRSDGCEICNAGKVACDKRISVDSMKAYGDCDNC
jgi:hypothetical protein